MTTRFKISLTVLILALASGLALAQSGKPLLLQQPSVSRTQIVFAFAGDLWTVGRDGGSASRLTTGVGIENDPFFSPDGTLVAFSGQYEGNTDVYRRPGRGRDSPAADLSSGPRRGRRLDARWETGHLPLDKGQLLAGAPSLHGRR